MAGEDFLDLLDEYLHPPAEPNLAMVDVQVVWERDNPDYGARHIWDEHQITEQEVEEVLFEVPPHLEARRHPNHPGKTIFWGATRYDRWIFVVCEDWTEHGHRYLRPITAFAPTEGRAYWEEQA